jgi:hemerythrin superfamily protein
VPKERDGSLARKRFRVSRFCQSLTDPARFRSWSPGIPGGIPIEEAMPVATRASSRSAAAKKAAATRKANAAKRSAAAKKAAETRRRRAATAASARKVTRPAGKSATRKSSTRPSRSMDAVTLIEKDHRTVEGLFARFEGMRDTGTPGPKRQVVERIVKELSIHAAIEENELYPVIREHVPGGDAHVNESLQEHQEAKEALAELDRMDGDDPRLDQKVMTLIADVRHHVEEEETEMLPKVRQSLDQRALRQLGDTLRQAKKTAPTRPHPHAPAEPPGSSVAGMMAGVVDRVRDAIAGRDSS